MTTTSPEAGSSQSQEESKPPQNQSRHAARVLALQVLFQWDFHGTAEFWKDEFWSHQRVTSQVQGFAEQLVEGVQANRQELDRLISQYAKNWTIDRMPVVDRNILRQALFELIWLPDVPAKVSVNEALQLAKNFADEDTKGFVNGILDQVLKQDPRLQEKRTAIPQNSGNPTKERILFTAGNQTLPTPDD